ncbi:hypothetical protein [Cerasicoccus frondis]|uniref:hypothetical protein n=1 Tax=Cerasicoccus frondis TaxID=490090 RepID=UPI002852AF4E|nr:hypothetical protein [Cerasicoccus frondis]
MLTATSSLLLGMSLTTNAATLVNYDFAGATTSPNISGANVDTQNASFGTPSGSSVIGTSGNGGGNVYYGLENAAASDSEATAVSNNMYSQFTLAPADGFSIDFTDLSFSYGGTSPAANSYTANFIVRSSADNFTSTLGTFTQSVPAASSNPTFAASPATISLSGFEPTTEATIFRIYAFVTLDGGETFNVQERPRIDNVQITGEVTMIPEASHAAIALSGLAFGLLTLRKRFA